jgi:6-phosphogluconolactonase
MHTSVLFVGSYTSAQGGRGRGVTVRPLGCDGEVLAELQAVALSNPAFLVLAGDLLFAAEEEPGGRVVSMSSDRGQLTVISSAASGGGLPCHLAMDSENSQLVIANYLTGSVSVVAVAPEGELGLVQSAVLPYGKGPVCERQESPHPHQLLQVPDKPEEWLVTDLGSDRLLRYALRGIGRAPALLDAYPLPAGAGPRHMGWVHNRLLVVGELDSQLHVFDPTLHGLNHVGAVSTIDVSSGIERTQPNFPSHLEISENLEFAYVANRGRNSIAVFDISGMSRGGKPVLTQEVSSGGEWPRHFVFHAGRLYIANQRSNTIAVLGADREAGIIGELIQVVPTGTPMCLVVSV